MRRSKLFRIAGAVFGLTLAACGSEVEGQAPDSDTTQDTSNEVNDTEPDTQPDTEPDTTPDTVEDTDTTADTDTAEDTDTTADTDTVEDTDTTADTDTVEDTDTTADTDTAEDTDTTTDTDTVTPPTGESCSDPHVVVVPSPFAAPIVVTGDTTGKADDHSVDASACLGMDFAEGDGAPDEAWSFTAPTAGVYRISALSGSGDVGFYVLETCGADAACLGGSDFEGVGAANLDTRLYRMNAGQTVFVVVDGFEPTNAGTYTLTIDPPEAFVPGDVCEDAITLTLDDTGAYSGTGDTSTTTFVTDNYEVGLCGPDFAYTGTASPDMVFEFVAPTAGTWTATLTPETGVDLMMYAYLGANCGQTCAGAVDDAFDGEAEELVLADLQAGDTVRFVVDSWIPASAGAFTLSVSSVCTPSCDLETCGNNDGCGGVCGCGVGEGCLAGTCAPAGETCADPIPLTAGPDNSWTGAGNLTGRLNDVTGYTTTLGCGVTGFSSNGNRPDETFSFTPTTTGPYVVSVTAIGAATDVLFAVFTGPGCATGSCLTFTDNNPEGTFTDTNTLELTAGTAYTIVVDSYSDSALGAFTVNVAPQCQPFCAEGSCNVGDGCGGTCGCADGEQCNDSNTCEPIPLPAGETCNNPVAMTFATVEAVPTWTGAGTLVGRTADVPFVASCANLGTGTPTGSTVEQTFSFTTTTAGLYTVTLTSASARDLWMHLYTGPGCEAASCIGYFDTEIGEPEVLTLTLPAATEVTLVVEPWSTFTTLDAFTVKVTKDCDPACTAGCGISDGCGGTCGCAAGQTCNQPAAPEAGTCDNIPGETCAAPLPLVAGANETWTGAGDLTGNVDAHSRGSCAQLGTGTPTGTGAVDEFWSFTPTTTGLHKIDLTRGTVGDVWFAIYEGTGCINSGATLNCRGYYQRETGTAVETLTLSLTAGTNYTIVVEPSSSFTTLGTYTLGISKVCDPVCTAGVCGGTDSCGGTCGCPSGEACAEGVCVATPGDTCAAPFTSNAANFTTTVNTCTMTNNFTVSNETGGCQSSTSTTANTRDFVVAYTPPITGQYRVNSTQSPDLVVNVVTGACPTAAFGTCLAGADDPATLTFNGVAGETVYVVVDQYSTPCAAPTDVQNTTLTIDYVCVRTPGICDGQLCNALDNCGQPCGCTAGQNCNTDGSCGERPGNSCTAPLVVNAETFTTTVNTCLFDNNFSVTSETAGCQSNTSTAGTVHRDFVVAFTPPTSGRYTAASTQGPDLILNVVDGACPAATFGTCLAGGDTPASGTFDAVGGQTYHIVVDQYSNACSSSTTQDTTFTITKQCLPDCTGKTCDQDDGCGTLCGCPTGGICTGNVCEAAVADSCANPGSFTLAAGIYTATGDIRGAGVADNFRANTCTSFVEDGYVPGATTASKDQVFAFTAPSTGEFDITLDPGTATDIYFQVISGATCADATCVGVMDEGGSGTNEAATVDMVAGTTYWIVVDSWSASSTAPHPFTLTIEGLCTPGPNECTGQACDFVTSCGTPCGCADGEVCTAGVCGEAPPAPYDVCETAGMLAENTVVTVDTCTLESDYDLDTPSTCAAPSTAAPDAVFGFTAVTAGEYVFSVTGDATMDIVLNTVTEATCPATITTCSESADDVLDGEPESLTLTLAAGETAWLYVSGYAFFGSTDCGEVDVLVNKVQAEICDDTIDNDLDGDDDCDDSDCATDPACVVEEGASCAAPFQLAANGTNDVWTGSGSLVGAADDHGRGTCPQLATNSFTPTGTGTADEVWSFTTTEAGPYRIDLLRGAAGDIFYYVYSSSTCANDVCLGYVERVGSGTETQQFNLLAATTYYIVVESYSTFTTLSDYTLTVTKLCAPQCDNEVCGQADGCGGTCGCPSGESCQAGVCGAVPGDSCAAPFVVGAVPVGTPYSLTVDTCAMANDVFSTATNGCENTSTTTSAGKDYFVAFTPTESGTYVAASSQSPDLILNVVTGTCPTAGPLGTCIAAGDDPAAATFQAVAGTTYYLVVDAYSTACGSTTFTITQQCVSTGCGDTCNTTDNCGTACNCDAGETCSTSGAGGAGVCQFVGLPEGDACADPFEVTSLPYTRTLDTCTLTHQVSTTSGSGCVGVSSTTTGKDAYFMFTPAVTGYYRAAATEVSSVPDLVLNVVAGTCPETTPTTCLSGGDVPPAGTFRGEAGMTYYIVVDGYNTAACGNTTVTVEQVTPPAGNDCSTALTLSAGTGDVLYTATGSTTTNHFNDFALTGCTALGGATLPTATGRDVVYSLTVPESGDYNVSVFSTSTMVWSIREGASCDTSTCAGAFASSNVNDVTSVALTAGTQYWLVVDGGAATTTGSYTVKVAKRPVPADQCNTPTALALNVDRLIDTCVSLKDYSISGGGCTSNSGAFESVFTFTAPQAGSYRFRTISATADGVMNLVDGATCPAGPSLTCLTGADSGGTGGAETITRTLTEGQTLHVFVSGYGTSSASSCGGFTTTVTANFEVCTDGVDNDNAGGTDCADPTCSTHPSCQVVVPVDGDSCANPIALQADAGGWTSLGNLTGTADDFSDYETCALLGASLDPEADLDGQPDQVFSFTVPTDGRYTIEVLPGATDDLIWALYSGATCDEATCIGYTDLGLTGDDEVFTLPLTAGTNYYLVIDTFSDAPYEEFGVFVEGCVPTVACDGTTCGTDSCGTPCTCNSGTTCNDVTDVCEAATPVTVAAWNFGPDAAGFTLGATSGLAANLGKLLTETATGSIAGIAGGTGEGWAATTSGWDAGNGTKAWVVEFATTGHSSLSLKRWVQRSSNTGPRDFRVDYSLNGTDWTAVSGGTAVIGSSSAYTAYGPVALPAEMANKASVYLRWVMSSDIAFNGTAVVSGGTSRIDEIVIEGIAAP